MNVRILPKITLNFNNFKQRQRTLALTETNSKHRDNQFYIVRYNDVYSFF